MWSSWMMFAAMISRFTQVWVSIFGNISNDSSRSIDYFFYLIHLDNNLASSYTLEFSFLIFQSHIFAEKNKTELFFRIGYGGLLFNTLKQLNIRIMRSKTYGYTTTIIIFYLSNQYKHWTLALTKNINVLSLTLPTSFSNCIRVGFCLWFLIGVYLPGPSLGAVWIRLYLSLDSSLYGLRLVTKNS